MGRTPTGQLYEWKTKRGTTSYGARFRHAGTRRFVTFGSSIDGWTRAKADAAMADLMADVRRGLWVPPEERVPDPKPTEMPSFHEFATAWFEDRKRTGGRTGTGLSKKGQEDLLWQLGHHLLPYFANFQLDRIRVADVDGYRRFKQEEGRLSPHSINRTIGTLSSILEVAVEYEHVHRNVAKGRRRRLTVQRAPRTYLDRAAWIAALLDAAGELDRAGRAAPYRRAMLATLVFAGLRLGEVQALRWADVDLAGGVIRVHGTKTANATRTVRLLPALRDELATFAAGQPDRDRNALVFKTSPSGGNPGGRAHSATNTRRRILAPAIERANATLMERGEEPIPAGITPHSLRRTFASMLVGLGRDPATVMRAMGHATPGFTLSVYAAAMDARDGEQDRLRALVEGNAWASTGVPEAIQGYVP